MAQATNISDIHTCTSGSSWGFLLSTFGACTRVTVVILSYACVYISYYASCCFCLFAVQISMSAALVLKREVTTVLSTPHATIRLVHSTATVTRALTWLSAVGESGDVKVRWLTIQLACKTVLVFGNGRHTCWLTYATGMLKYANSFMAK